MSTRLRRASLALVLLAFAAVQAAAPASGPTLHFTLFAQTDLPLGQAMWTGREWLWNAENLGQIEATDADGRNVRPFAAFDQGGEEMRCAVPPNKYWPDGVYCHTPDNRIVRLNRDGSNQTVIARLPTGSNSDGAIAFDDAGRFGYALLAATGGSASDGGQLFAVRKDGRVQPLGSYPGPGGAENIAIAPAKFGTASGWCLFAIDHDSAEGRLLAMDRKGNVKTIATGLGNGLNPIMVVKGQHASGSPASGFYVADTLSRQIWFSGVSTGGVASLPGAVVVGTELTGQFWFIGPAPDGSLVVTPVTTDLPQQAWNLEGSAYVP
jgi:hypothetical protein